MRFSRARRYRTFAWFAFLLYLAVLLSLTLLRDRYSSFRMWPLSERLRLANFTPFRTIAFYLGGGESPQAALRNVAGNVLAFLPMGFLVPMVFPKLRRMRSILAASFAMSLALEIAQLLTGMGGFDVDDILLNVVGAAISGLAFGLAARVSRRSR